MDEQWKLVPIERSYDMRVKALMAFNDAENSGKDRDDALGAAFLAMLDATPHPPSALDERERYVKWLTETYPTIHTAEDAERWWSQEHISALAWEARAASAPSPDVDAAEQTSVAYRLLNAAEVADAQPMHPHDLNTSAGATAFLLEYFSTRIGRHDFGTYIRERLAKDFACALAQHLDSPQPSSNPGPLAAVVTDAMVDAYLTAQRKAVEEADRFGRPNIGGLHTNTVRDACRAGIDAAIAASKEGAAS